MFVFFLWEDQDWIFQNIPEIIIIFGKFVLANSFRKTTYSLLIFLQTECNLFMYFHIVILNDPIIAIIELVHKNF